LVGNWDLVGNNTPVFFIRDPIKFPDFIHTQKKNPQTNLKDPDMTWDFLSLVPESLHQVSILFSDRGTPDGFRGMNGYGSHTFKLVNAKNEVHYCKFHFKTDQGIKNLTRLQASELAGKDPDHATRDLFTAIAKKDYPSWTLHIQVMPEADAQKYRWNIFDVTKVWPHGDYPLIPVGKMVLNRNPTNYFAEIEQAAFSPSHLVPGIEASVDRMLQGRLFSYPDTHRHRLGPNYTQIPVNRPQNAHVNNYQRDGFMCVNGNFGSAPNYEPNSVGGPTAVGPAIGITFTPMELNGTVGRFPIALSDADFKQPAKLYEIQSKEGQERMVGNLAAAMSGAKPHIRRREMAHFKRSDKQWAGRLEKELAKAVGSKI
jgi:catalase